MSISIVLIYFFSLMGIAISVIYARKVVDVDIFSHKKSKKLNFISNAIEEGAMAFLSKEFKYVFLFSLVFALIIVFSISVNPSYGIKSGVYMAFAFLMGAGISSLSAYLGMKISVKGNVRTAVMADKSMVDAFYVAFNSGIVMSFALIGLAVFGLMSIALLFRWLIFDDPHLVMEIVSGFGLGGSVVALFGRVGGGIYTKAADVGADLVGKVEKDIPEDDPRNPAVIADNVGDNVGDIAGMGADLFGSCAEATCAALVIGASSPILRNNLGSLFYPLMITAISIPVGYLTTRFARVSNKSNIESVLKNQLLISTLFMTVIMYFITNWLITQSFEINGILVDSSDVFISFLSGLWSGLAIGYVTEYYTSHSYKPVREIAKSSQTGAATNIIYGLSLGYKSSLIPVISVAVSVFIAWHFAGIYGISIAAIGMISTVVISLAIDGYGPVCDNAGGIAEMCGLGKEVRDRTDILDAAGNTTAAIGKGFAIGSALITALALFGAYLTVVGIKNLNLLSPVVISSMLIGGVLPFVFSAQTMLAVGKSAYVMIEEVRRQFRNFPGIMKGEQNPDYKKCISISTSSAIVHMIAPGSLVIFTPIIYGVLFGPFALSGLLIGSLVSGLVLALSSANSGGAWDNAKKYIETGIYGGKGSDAHKAAVVGDTVGDPLKDTSGPSLNILMKLMAIISLVFSHFIVYGHDVIMKLFNV